LGRRFFVPTRKKFLRSSCSLIAFGRFNGAGLFHFGNYFKAHPPQTQAGQIHGRQDKDNEADHQQNDL